MNIIFRLFNEMKDLDYSRYDKPITIIVFVSWMSEAEVNISNTTIQPLLKKDVRVALVSLGDVDQNLVN